MRVVVREDVDALHPHLLDEVLEAHGHVLEAPHGRLVATGELDESDEALADLELGLDGGRAHRDQGLVVRDGPVGSSYIEGKKKDESSQ